MLRNFGMRSMLSIFLFIRFLCLTRVETYFVNQLGGRENPTAKNTFVLSKHNQRSRPEIFISSPYHLAQRISLNTAS